MYNIYIIRINTLWPSSVFDAKVKALKRGIWDWGFGDLVCTRPIILPTAELSTDFTAFERVS
jgi:hypothetical protein